LILATDIAFEIWLLKPSSLGTSAADLECIYRKKEDGIEMIDFLHIYTGDQNIPNFHIHNSNYSGPDQPRKNSNASDHQKPPNEGNFHDQHE